MAHLVTGKYPLHQIFPLRITPPPTPVTGVISSGTFGTSRHQQTPRPMRHSWHHWKGAPARPAPAGLITQGNIFPAEIIGIDSRSPLRRGSSPGEPIPTETQSCQGNSRLFYCFFYTASNIIDDIIQHPLRASLDRRAMICLFSSTTPTATLVPPRSMPTRYSIRIVLLYGVLPIV